MTKLQFTFWLSVYTFLMLLNVDRGQWHVVPFVLLGVLYTVREYLREQRDEDHL